MTLGALLDAGADESRFREELGKLPQIEFELKISRVVKKGISATSVDVLFEEGHHHRRLNDISELIRSSDLSEITKTRAIGIFTNLAIAEGTVHGTSPEEVHFHEVGAVDAIVDIVGAAIGIELLGIEKVIASPLPMGYGFVHAAHGKIPLPAPATVELLKGAPVYSAGIEGETVTPTGASIIKALASSFGEIPTMITESVGYGAGKSNFDLPNVLRVLVGETSAKSVLPPPDRVTIVETNIDDMNPEHYEVVVRKLLTAGALDVYMTPIYMKKGRPATLLSVICANDRTDDIAGIVLSETTSFGVRITTAERRCLNRRWETISTRFGDIRVKIGSVGDQPVKATPEYEDCRCAAETHAVPIREVYEETIHQYRA
jgi:uncharacterized protein (TIGR00299 family) protein